MRKLLHIMADWSISVIGLLFAWICFTGSARTIGLWLIIAGTVIYTINELSKKDDK